MQIEADVLKYTKTLQLTNGRTDVQTFHLEPWGNEYEMVPGATFEIYASSAQEGDLMVEFGDEVVTVYGWVGSTVSVFYQGKEL